MTKTPSTFSLLLIAFSLLWAAPTTAQDATPPAPTEEAAETEEVVL